ncbi:MAG: hypothetical protein AVDCRST_MAG05-1097, partial [uncultured Rubrobacteraceae bacterium]
AGERDPSPSEAERGTPALRDRHRLLRPTRVPLRLHSNGGRGGVPRDHRLRAGREETRRRRRRAMHGRHVRRPADRARRASRRRLRPRGGRLVPQHAHRSFHRRV